MTYESVAHCCFYRLRDRGLAEQVSLTVIAGLIERPRVFRHFGLPFSGRVAHLAELGIVAALSESGIRCHGDWEGLRTRLLEVSPEGQRVFVMACVEGYSDADLAKALDLELDAAVVRRDETIGLMQDLCKPLRLLPAPDPEREPRKRGGGGS